MAHSLEELKPNFAFLDKEYPGENELVWCKRCQKEHKRGAPPEIQYARFITANAGIIAQEIDNAVISELLKHEF